MIVAACSKGLKSMVKKKNNSPVLVYNNDLNRKVSLSSLSPTELDIFFTILVMLREKRKLQEKLTGIKPGNAEEITLTFDRLKELSHYSQSSETRFRQYLITVYHKVLGINFVIDTGDSYSAFNLFSSFEVSEKERTVKIITNPARSYILESLDSNFTIMKLRILTEIPTANGKNLARLISQFNSTGVAIINLEGEGGLRNQLGIPNLPVKEITRRVIKPSIEYIKKYFPDLKYEYIREKGGSGRKVKAVKFTFKPKKWVNEEDYEDLIKNPSEVKLMASESYQETQICPACGEPLIEREMNGVNVWCHKDGYKPDAKCKKVFNTIAEINGYEEMPRSKRDKNSDETAKKINEMLQKKKSLTEIKEQLGL